MVYNYRGSVRLQPPYAFRKVAHELLTSVFTVTTGIVSSLSGILNDTRFL